MVIQKEWSINDLADAHEFIEWTNARTRAAQAKSDREREAAKR